MESCTTLLSAASNATAFDGKCGEVDSDIEEPHTPLAVVVKHEDDDGKIDHFNKKLFLFLCHEAYSFVVESFCTRGCQASQLR